MVQKRNLFLSPPPPLTPPLTSLDGSGKRNSLSNRPGLLRAGSMASIRLVAPMTTTSPRLSRPSMRASSVDTMDEWIWS